MGHSFCTVSYTHLDVYKRQPIGILGEIVPNPNDFEDIKKAAKIVRATGRFDIGQAIVISDGNVLAIEAQEGTDMMLSLIHI